MLTNFTSESVCSGHPDKICDQISDAIVDAALTIDKKSRVAVETLVTADRIVLAGEVTCPKEIDYETIARKIIADLGYTKKEYGFWDQSPVSIYIHTQAPDISVGVDNGGAGDQGMMFGFACNETKELLPLPITLAHKLVATMDKTREQNLLPYLRPDGKAEVRVDYKDHQPISVAKVVLAVPHDPKISNKKLTTDLWQLVVTPVLSEYGFRVGIKDVIVNGTGKWAVGGPVADTGVTGRKIIVDTYGAFARHGGGAFSGKDPTKVDRSGAYATRYIAKNLVANNLADRCEVRVAYVIGQSEPIAFDIETFGTEKTTEKIILAAARKILDLRVKNILEKLELRQPIYRETARYGHFGRNGFPWERVVKI